jgi:hypothetical protein
MTLAAQFISNPDTAGPWASWSLLFALLIGHALADYPLQGKFLAIRKNRHIKSIDYTGDSPPQLWVYCLSAHSLVHAGTVWVIIGALGLKSAALFAFIEFVLHWLIDFAKCEKWTNFHQDQALHAVSKLGYVAAIYWL